MHLKLSILYKVIKKKTTSQKYVFETSIYIIETRLSMDIVPLMKEISERSPLHNQSVKGLPITAEIISVHQGDLNLIPSTGGYLYYRITYIFRQFLHL